MPTVHATAVIEGDVDLADDVVVGPHSVITGPVTIGAGTRLVAGVHVQGPTTIGSGNILYPNVCLGFAPQSVAYDPEHPGEGLVVGDHNTLREGVTMHRAMTEEGPTRVGNHNFFMANAHVGHDCRVGDRGTFANNSSFGGHVRVEDGVTLGGGAGVHQWARVGRGVMVQGNAGVTQDVIPFGLVTGINVCANVNIIGMRRSGMSSAEVDLVRWIHRTVCRRGLLIANALEVLRERSDEPLVAEYIDFIEHAKARRLPRAVPENARPRYVHRDVVCSPMLSFCVLGSGSGGNSTLLVRRGAGRPTCTLIDCGLSVRATAARLAMTGYSVDDVTDVLLTHLDHDHISRGWVRQIRKRGIDVHLHRQHRNRAVRIGITGHTMQLYREPFHLADDMAVEPIMLAHDDLGAVGFVIEHAGVRLGFATDLGRVPKTLLDRFVDLDGLAIESNYDRAMQKASHRPAFLKRRIMGGRGHLSNDESLDAVLSIAGRSRLSHIVPLHLSRQCNDPRLIQRLYARKAPHLLDRVTITSQKVPTPVLHLAPGAGEPRRGEQLVMF